MARGMDAPSRPLSDRPAKVSPCRAVPCRACIKVRFLPPDLSDVRERRLSRHRRMVWGRWDAPGRRSMLAQMLMGFLNVMAAFTAINAPTATMP
jgi:hypothetical protein